MLQHHVVVVVLCYVVSCATVLEELTKLEDSQGGIGPAGLSTEDLHVLDLTQAKPRWHRLVIHGSWKRRNANFRPLLGT